MNVGKNNIKWL